MIQFYNHLDPYQILDMKNEYISISCGWQKLTFRENTGILYMNIYFVSLSRFHVLLQYFLCQESNIEVIFVAVFSQYLGLETTIKTNHFRL